MRFLHYSNRINQYRNYICRSRRSHSLNSQSVDDTKSNLTNISSLKTLNKHNDKNNTSNELINEKLDQTLDKYEQSSKDIEESKDKSVVLRKPIPKNFIKETLLPHLEHNVAYNCMKFPPEVVLQIGIAYSKLPHFIRQRSIEDALIESFRYRMVDYTAPDCIQLLNTCFQLQGLRSVAVYDDIISRLEVPHIYNSITSINRLGICRSISKIINHSQLITGSGNKTNSDNMISSSSINTEFNGTNNSNNNKLNNNTNVDYNNSNTYSNNTNSFNTNSFNSKSLSKQTNRSVDNLKMKDLFKVDFYNHNDNYKSSPIKPWSYFVKNHRDKRIANLVDRMINFCENRILPQLEYELKTFDSDELTDLLSVLAQRTERDGSCLDFPVISILMSNIMRLYESTSLLNSLNNLSSLCRLRIRHDEFLSLVIKDLRNPLKVNNIYHKHLSRCIWSLARYDLLNDVISDLLPHITHNVPKFNSSCFARLSQVSRYYSFSDKKSHNKFTNSLNKTCLCLLNRIDELSPKDLVFFVSGLMNLSILPTSNEYLIEKKTKQIKPKFDKDERYLGKSSKTTDSFQVLSKLSESLKNSDSDFDLWEIERLVDTTKSFKEYEYLLDHFPESWRNIIHPVETNE